MPRQRAPRCRPRRAAAQMVSFRPRPGAPGSPWPLTCFSPLPSIGVWHLSAVRKVPTPLPFVMDAPGAGKVPGTSAVVVAALTVCLMPNIYCRVPAFLPLPWPLLPFACCLLPVACLSAVAVAPFAVRLMPVARCLLPAFLPLPWPNACCLLPNARFIALLIHMAVG